MGEYLVLQPTNWPLEHEAFDMKTCSVIIAACLAAGGAAAAQTSSPGHHRVLTRISDQTGVPVRRLSKQEAKTGLGFGGLEKANLLAKATGHSFRQVVSRFRSGEGWGKIAHDAGLNLGKLVSRAHRSDKAAQNSHKTQRQNAHGQSAVGHGNNGHQRGRAISHGKGRMGAINGFGHSGFAAERGGAMRGIGHGHGGR